MSLYTKYRPKDWDSVVGQDLITTILRESLKNQHTSHAYIFTGSRGTGKTTSARIFAKALNCTALQNGNPCHQCENCQAFDSGNILDIIEIDAASTTGVDNIRDLIESAKFPPVHGQHKIYIIDEVHMLSTSAFNALLKTLEEPPTYIKFILATTDIHKVPETVRSRAQRFDFRKISKKDLISRLNFVAQNENIDTENGTIEIIADLARGGMRDALTLFEQYSAGGKLQKNTLEQAFSLIDNEFLERILSVLIEKKFSELKEIIKNLEERNIQAQNFFDQILLILRDKMVENLENEDFFRYENIFSIFRAAYSGLFSIPNGNILIETTLMQAINFRKNTEEISEKNEWKTPTQRPIEDKKPLIEKNTIETISEKKIANNFQEQYEEHWRKIGEKIQEKYSEKPVEIEEKKENPPTKNTTISDFSYRKLLDSLKNEPVILATLKTASFKQNETHIDFTFGNKWNADKMNESKYQSAIISALNNSFWWNWTINVTHSSNTNSATNFVDDVF